MKDNFSDIVLNQTIMDSMPGLVYIYNQRRELVAWNKRAEEVLDIQKKSLKPTMLVDL